MARIRALHPGTQRVSRHPTEVDCSYQEIISKDGAKYIHLSTFGSDDRKSAPKSSQSIQLDEQAARELVEILVSAFRIT
jgi:hypothetical protein